MLYMAGGRGHEVDDSAASPKRFDWLERARDHAWARAEPYLEYAKAKQDAKYQSSGPNPIIAAAETKLRCSGSYSKYRAASVSHLHRPSRSAS